MTSRATPEYWRLFNDLPKEIQNLSRLKYLMWIEDTFHPSIQFKQITGSVWSARVNLNYRALARVRGDDVIWFWIGKHEEYDRILSNLKK